MSKVPRGYTGHARDAAKLQVVPDPKVTVGRLRVLRRTDGFFILYDGSLPLGADVDGGALFTSVEDARRRAEELTAHDEKVTPSRSTYDADAESFAAMKRALANGFAKHEPAYSVEEIHALGDGGRRT